MPPYPGQPAPRRNGLIIAAICGGLAVLLIGGVLAWAMMGTAAPYSSIGECDDLLAEDVLADTPGAEGNPVDQFDTFQETPLEDEDVLEAQTCVSSDNPDEPSGEYDTSVMVAVYRHSPKTEEDDYADVQRTMERARDDVYDHYEIDLEDGEGTVTPAGTNAEMEVRSISTGDGGDAFWVDDPDEELSSMHATGRWGSAAFTTRNLEVYVTYSGTPEIPAERHIEIVADLANAVEGKISRTIETE
ncbi:hypothetical protein F4561_004614 [Lipingzhangella halophila]|uniref:Uncharacterized protein n=1 Tax=Lipingzhangella halophila TaxID=1783352 RepID=A0A7W7W5F3_9ACTN|nr:hypothetical protein [Lipingzhangella halophila]MBB4933794.1 hypothetical protein [Lipingzhangella halophila]